nr:hypothetical protein 2 [Bacillaceae bacterium]
MTQLNMKVIKEDNKRYKEFVTIDIEAQGNTYEVKIYPFLSPSLVAKLRDELIEFRQNVDKEKLTIEDTEWDDLISYFIVRHFTNIKMTKSKKAKTIYEEFKEAINSKLFEVILKSFPEESIMSVHEKIYELAEMNAILEQRMKQIQKEIQGLDLENKDILFNENRKQIPEV